MKPWTSWIAPVGMAASCLLWVGCGGSTPTDADSQASSRARHLGDHDRPATGRRPGRTGRGDPRALPRPDGRDRPERWDRRLATAPSPTPEAAPAREVRRFEPPRRPRRNRRPRRPARRPPTSCSPSPAAPPRIRRRRPRPLARRPQRHPRTTSCRRPWPCRIPRRRITSWRRGAPCPPPSNSSLPNTMAAAHPCRRRRTGSSASAAATANAAMASAMNDPNNTANAKQQREHAMQPVITNEAGDGRQRPGRTRRNLKARGTSASRCTAAAAFLAALQAKNPDMLAQATALRAPTEASPKYQKVFTAILEQSLAPEDLDELAKKLEGYTIIGQNTAPRAPANTAWSSAGCRAPVSSTGRSRSARRRPAGRSLTSAAPASSRSRSSWSAPVWGESPAATAVEDTRQIGIHWEAGQRAKLPQGRGQTMLLAVLLASHGVFLTFCPLPSSPLLPVFKAHSGSPVRDSKTRARSVIMDLAKVL